ncbi:MAG: FxsA family protein [Peptococcaceae bacterium]|nr:FxsA family protein [Peptococcaceae bacterium]
MLKLLAIFIIIPFIELYIIIQIGSKIGFWPTLALILVPGLLGAAMARSQGIAVFSAVKREIARGRLPGTKILDGILIFCGGLLLITPGVLTDILGLSVFFPGMRKIYRNLLVHRFLRAVAGRRMKLFIKNF